MAPETSEKEINEEELPLKPYFGHKKIQFGLTFDFVSDLMGHHPDDLQVIAAQVDNVRGVVTFVAQGPALSELVDVDDTELTDIPVTPEGQEPYNVKCIARVDIHPHFKPLGIPNKRKYYRYE
jgi:hypothetical protein